MIVQFLYNLDHELVHSLIDADEDDQEIFSDSFFIQLSISDLLSLIRSTE